MVLNRAPTLHKLSMQAFRARLTDSKVIRLHPLVCAGFNADFDGDQMAVHVPLSYEARAEALALMLSTRNVLHPAHGMLAITPTQEMVLGLYYMTVVAAKRADVRFASYADVSAALMARAVGLHTRVEFWASTDAGQVVIESTPGRLLVNELVPQACGFLYTTSMPALSKSEIIKLTEDVLDVCGKREAVVFCEQLMLLGFKHATLSGTSLACADLRACGYKQRALQSARRAVAQLAPGAAGFPKTRRRRLAFAKV